MQGNFSVPGCSELVRVAIASLACVAVLCAAGCSSAQVAGALDDGLETSELVASAAPREPSVAPSTGPGSSNGPARDDFTQRSSPQPNSPTISDARVRIVNETVRREAAAVGLGTVHDIRVQSESPKVSLAMLRVTRNGSPQILGATVVRIKGSWTISNVDTLPGSQDIRW